MAISVKPHKEKKRVVSKADREEKKVSQVKQIDGKKGLFKKTVVVERKKIEGYLSNIFLLDTTAKDEGYVGMLKTLASTGNPVTPLNNTLSKSKYSGFIDSVIESMRSSPVLEEKPEIQVGSNKSGKRKVEVTFL